MASNKTEGMKYWLIIIPIFRVPTIVNNVVFCWLQYSTHLGFDMKKSFTENFVTVFFEKLKKGKKRKAAIKPKIQIYKQLTVTSIIV